MPDPLDPQKFHIMSSKTKKALFIGFLFVVFIVIPFISFFYYKFAVTRPSQTDKEITFEITSGEAVPQIASNLSKLQAINSEFLFSLYVLLNKYDRNIQAGTYVIPAGTSIEQLAELIQHGVSDKKVTFIEGWRVEEYARAATKVYPKIDYTDFVRKAAPFEGYLFPDTYLFNDEITEEGLIEHLRSNFDMRTKDILREDKLSRTGLTKEQVIILASIVEREVNREEDRPLVAGILLKRLREGMRIDADATTQYAVATNYLCGNVQNGICAPSLEDIFKFNWWPKDLTVTDLDSDSPFNTRKVAGLPPRPISNPSWSAIDSVVNYQESDYYYYLTDKYGIAHYAKTLKEHEANIAIYLQ